MVGSGTFHRTLIFSQTIVLPVIPMKDQKVILVNGIGVALFLLVIIHIPEKPLKVARLFSINTMQKVLES